MTLDEIKVLRIVDYLHNIGINPARVSGHNYWYCSPLREESTPSFKVDDSKNLWFDHGEGHGGNLIELGKYLYNTKDVHTVLNRISENASTGNFVRHTQPRIVPEPTKKDEIVYHFLPLSHRVLCSYIASRMIDVRIAMKYCKEVHYVRGNTPCYGIAFPNDTGGHEMRNLKFKSCIGNKDITTILESERHTTINIFEGFMDFLSFMTMKQVNASIANYKGDYLIMNSVSNLKKTLEKIRHYDCIGLYLDNDDAGRKTATAIKQEYGDKVQDFSYLFEPYKDVNDYLIHNTQLFKSKVNEQG